MTFHIPTAGFPCMNTHELSPPTSTVESAGNCLPEGDSRTTQAFADSTDKVTVAMRLVAEESRVNVSVHVPVVPTTPSESTTAPRSDPCAPALENALLNEAKESLEAKFFPPVAAEADAKLLSAFCP